MDTNDERLGQIVKLLGGDGAINEVYVAEQVDAIARAGHGGAALLAAVIAGIGYGRARDWSAALEWLAIAAEKDAGDARQQLQLLAGGDVSANSEPWREIAARVDLRAWTAARQTRLVLQRPYIGMADGFLDARACAWLINRAAPLQAPSLVYDPVTGRAAKDDVRSNTTATFTILQLDLPTLLVRERIANTMGMPVLNFERTSIFQYTAGQEFSSHVDYLNPSPQLNDEIRNWGQRPLTFLVYLNDAFEAGETHFLEIDKKLRGGVGDALFFRNVDESGAPDMMTTHAGVAPANGEKWLLSQFIRNKPQLPG